MIRYFPMNLESMNHDLTMTLKFIIVCVYMNIYLHTHTCACILYTVSDCIINDVFILTSAVNVIDITVHLHSKRKLFDTS